MDIDAYLKRVSEAFARHAASDGSIPAAEVAQLTSDIRDVLEKVAVEARDDGYEEGHLGEDL